MNPTRSCPDRQVLERVVEGDLSQDESRQWSDHLESCLECQTVLDELAATQGTWEGARYLQEDLEGPSSSVQRVIEQVEQAQWAATFETDDNQAADATPDE